MEQSIERTFAGVGELRRHLLDEIVVALGLRPQGWTRALTTPLLWLPAHRFSVLASNFDRLIGESGLREASRWMLTRLIRRLRLQGTGSIPAEGPLLIVSNHPGTMDGLAILANLPRDDVRVVATGIPFFQVFRAGRQRLIYVPRQGGGRATVVREMLRHLEGGGALLLFPGGNVEPDPAVLPGAQEALRRWSGSVEIVLRRLPDTHLLVSMVSGVLSPRWLRHPLVLRREANKRQLMAEFMGIIPRMVLGARLPVTPNLSFGRPVTAGELGAEPGGARLMPAIIEYAQSVLVEHLSFAAEPRQGELVSLA